MVVVVVEDAGKAGVEDLAVFQQNAPAQILPALAGDGGSKTGLPAAKVILFFLRACSSGSHYVHKCI